MAQQAILTPEEFEAYAIKSMTIKQIASLYRTYKNDFITVQAFADYLAVSDQEAQSASSSWADLLTNWAFKLYI